MNKIRSSLKPRIQGALVAELQDGLQLLLQRGVLLRDNEYARQEIADALKEERAKQIFGAATTSLVSEFRKQHRLPYSGEVDARTAAALNDTIAHENDAAAEFQYLVRGRVQLDDALPAVGYTVTAFVRGLRRLTPLGHATTGDHGGYEIRCSVEQFERAGRACAGLLRSGNASGTSLRESAVLINACEEAMD